MTTKASTQDEDVRTISPNGTKPIGFDMGAAEDLAALEEQGIDVEWEDALKRVCYQPDGVTPLTVTVAGSLSKRYRAVQELNRGRGWKAGLERRGEEEDAAAIGARQMKEETESVAACILRWSAGFTDKGKPFEYSKANAVRLLALNPHMQQKLALKMGAHADFFGANSASSKP